MSLLFTPFTIKNITFKNRIAVSPMCEYSAINGFANNWHLVHLGSRAVGGAGLVMMEATAVSPEARISIGDLGIWDDEHIPKLKEITTFIHENGSIAGIQLAHAGRKASFDIPWVSLQQLANASGGWDTVSASAELFNPSDKTPISLTISGIEEIKADFKSAAQRAITAGFKIIEIHAAHGYLLHQFLSPISNKRTDKYGGTFENRIRFLLETVAAVQEVWPKDNPLFVRISATDWADGGWSLDESIQLAVLLKEMGIDLIDTSSGGLTLTQQIPLSAGYQVQFAAAIKQEAKIATGAVGLITSAKQAEAILQNNEADLIFIAREFLRDPYFPLHAAFELEDDVKWPSQYERAKPRKARN
ncbi:MAG TPA: NADPH dehydrogenase NamA [Pedobacter sp.]|nr:NADPH dehydrogenase NamA [Pedobacter sp.]